MKYGNWTVLREYPDERTGRKRFDLICDCGRESTTLAHYVTSGRSTRCRGCSVTDSKTIYRDESSLPAAKSVYAQYKFRAKGRNLEFNLTFEEVLELAALDCHYCGLPPSNICRGKKAYHLDFIYSGIDRVDNARGYDIDNVVPCCVTCNLGKRSLGLEEFYAWIERLANHRRPA